MALGALDIIIAADTAQLRKGMDEAVGIMKSSTQKMETVAKTAAGVIAGVLAIGALEGSIKRTLDFADSLSKMSQKVGVSVDALYAMQAAGKLSDVSIETLEKSLLKFNKGLGSAELGTGNTANALKNLGISLKDSSGHLKTSDQYLYEVADRFKDMPNGIAKSTLAMELFGKSGAEMIPLLNGGSEALKEYSGLINTETAQAAERFNDSMTKIGLSLEASTTSILTGMLPAIESLSGTFEDMAEWVLKNQDAVDEFTAQASNDLTALGMVGADAFKLISDTSGGMLNVLASVFNTIPGLMGRSSDEAIENFGFFEYFILGMSTATNGIGQFVANAKMAYASVAEAHAKYGSISGLLTDGGYDAAKARMDYHAASLEAKKYTNNVSETYNALIGLKKSFKAKTSSSDSGASTFVLEDFDKPKSGKTPKVSKAEKEAKELKDLEQRMFEERINDGIKRFETELKQDDEFHKNMISARMEKESDFNKSSADFQAARWADYLKTVKDDTIKMNTVFEDAFKSMEDSMVNMFMTGKFEAEDFFNTIIEGMIRMQIRNSITQPLTTAIGGMDFGSMFSGMFAAYDGGMIPNYAVGGYTGDGGKYEPKGVVHGGEYVIPQWMVQKSPALIGSLESTRKRGFADGGFVSGNVFSSNNESNVVVNIQNNSGTQVSADNVNTRFDASKIVIDLAINGVQDAIIRNKNGIRDTIRGVR